MGFLYQTEKERIKMGDTSTESYMFELENESGNRLSVIEVADEIGREYFIRIENKEMDSQQFGINKRVVRKLVNYLKEKFKLEVKPNSSQP